MKYPQALKPGDTIAICSPAGPVDAEYVHKAADVLRAEGWKVKIMPHTLGRNGQYSGTDDERFTDLRDALMDPEVRAVICSRGGYGVVHLMDRLESLLLADDPKWVVGYSDISALHAMLNHKGVASIHGSMASHIQLGPENEDNASLFAILRGERPAYSFPGHAYDRPGIATGTLLGGNLAVLAELINTPYDLLRPDSILFIEDIAEPIYKVERIMYQLRLSGLLKNIRGLIVGQFTDYKPNENYADMETMIRDMVAPYSYPVAFGAPIGHVFHNIPVIEGATVTLKVSPSGTDSIIFWRG